MAIMKTNVEIDDVLIADALQVTGLETTEKVIELALQILVQIKRQEAIKAFRGKLAWEGNLDLLREDA